MSDPWTVQILQASGRRSRTVCEAFRQGIRARGDYADIYDMHRYRLPAPLPDALVFYGYGQPRRWIMNTAMGLGVACVYVDLGYWARIEGGRFQGYHKCVINALHPDRYFQRVERTGARADRFPEASWRPVERGDAILVPGLSEKGAWTFDLKPEQWERRIIARLREITDRPIIYRPKPSWKEAKPIHGVEYAAPSIPIDQVLESGIHCVVNHHSNVAVDALLRGIPNISVRGVASVIGTNQIERLDALETPDRREVEKWKNQVAWVQWNVKEMGVGTAWAHLKKEIEWLRKSEA